MTGYSFGARWVGVMALRDPPPPEPLHKMAIRLRTASRSRIFHIEGHDISADGLLPVLAGVRFRQGLAGQAARAHECLRVEQSVRAGRSPEMRSWLRNQVAETLGPRLAQRPGPGSIPSLTERAIQPVRRLEPIVATDWATAYPQAADSPWLPPLRESFAAEIERLGLKRNIEAERWLRWACLHSTYLYESVPSSPISAGVLDVLAMLGRGWMRIAILERARGQRGEFAANNEVSAVLAGDEEVRGALGAWATAHGAGFYGKGEAGLLAAGSRSTAPESVAMQVLGALSLATASQAPADALLEAIDYRAPAWEPDWLSLLVSELKVQPKFERSDEGPDHDKIFTVSVVAAGRSSSASAASVKAARKAALRDFVTRYLPRAVSKPASAPAKPSRPQAYPATSLTRHAQAVSWAQMAFEVADAGLMTQALTHRSWVYENKALVAAAHQRDYGALATEGSEILTHLVRHQHALQLLNASFQVPSGHATSPHVTGGIVAELFDRMPVAAGVLRSRGLDREADLSTDVREDVAQAIAAAAWRANGDLMAERQPVVLAHWIRSFTPTTDPTTQLQEYCARVRVGFAFAFQQRGPDHLREYRATLTFEVDGQPSWRGNWCAGKTLAKHSAATGALDSLLGSITSHGQDQGSEDGSAIVRGLLLAQLRAIDPEDVNPGRELANGTLCVDLLAAGDYAAYEAWSKNLSSLLPPAGSATADRLTQFYEAVLSGQRRDAISQWIVRHTPARGGQSTEPAARIRAWWASTDPGLLVLLNDFLPMLHEPDLDTAVMDYVDAQALAVSNALRTVPETERTQDMSVQTLTIRIDGADLSATFDPVVQVVESAGVGARWARESQALSVALSALPSLSNPKNSAALVAVKNARNDPWLDKIHIALSEFLTATERIFGAEDEPSPGRMDELSLAELSLILQLQSNGEEQG